MRVKVEVKVPTDKGAIKRMPSNEEIKDALDHYCIGFNGVVIYHSSLYDYQFDTQGSDYHSVDSIVIIGHIESTLVEKDKVYSIIEVGDEKTVEPILMENKYICFFRAQMQANPKSTDRTLHISNLFAVDMIHVLESEMTDSLELSEIIGL